MPPHYAFTYVLIFRLHLRVFQIPYSQSNVYVRELNDISHIQEFLFWKIELLQAIDDFVTF